MRTRFYKSMLILLSVVILIFSTISGAFAESDQSYSYSISVAPDLTETSGKFTTYTAEFCGVDVPILTHGQ